MAGDIFKEAPGGPDFADNAGDVGPEMARIRFAKAVPREREWLARIARRDDMNAVAPRAAVKGPQIVPDRSRSQGLVRHPTHESGRGETVSLDITHSSISGFSEVKAKVKSADSGAKAEAAKLVMSSGGMNSHKMGPFLCGRAARGVGSGMASDC